MSMKNRNSPGTDRINSEHLKNLPPVLINTGETLHSFSAGMKGEPGRDDIHSRRRGTDGFPMSRSRSTERVYLSALHAEKSRIRKTTDSMVVPRTLHEARHVAIMLFEPLARIEATGQPMPSIGTLNIVAF
ncbi:hypothetical protein RB195_018410 [Necator americanus]|uniref:Uncharacterized protein n=1 Tax=Necator americanus TaxID=51031 RepID=A0ABR1C9Q6_NECAM